MSTDSHLAGEPEISIDGAEDQLEPPVTGEAFGKYEIVGELAVGGMAEVFLGVQNGLEGFVKVVVLKRVLPQYSSDADFVRMFADEARLAARLEHPNIVRTYEFGEVAGQYYTAMEYLPGEDLSKVIEKLGLAKQQMPLELAAGIVVHILSGLQCAHELTDTAGRPLNLVHRDVNPANVILTYSGEVKLIDFGIAKTNERHTVNGAIKGKVAYMSPEQLLDHGVDQRSDVFSTGVVLWELLTGRPLFLRDTEAATLYAIMNDPLPAPSRLRADVPPELDRIVLRALSRTPSSRYSSAEEMAGALERFLAIRPKYDSRTLAKLVEALFGSQRADAKRAISQTRSLGRNISLVMKLRTDVRTDLAHQLALAGANQLPIAGTISRSGRSKLAAFWGVLLVVGAAAGVAYVVTTRTGADRAPTVAPRSAVEITSEPPGAAIAIGGEPTGLKTPATFTGLTARELEIRLELAGRKPLTTRIEVPETGSATKHFELVYE